MSVLKKTDNSKFVVNAKIWKVIQPKVKQPNFKSEKGVSAVIFETSFILMIAHRPFINMVRLPRECTLKVKEILGQ